MVMKSTGSPQYPEAEPTMLPVTNHPEPKKPSLSIFRAAPAHTFKKHVGILSVVTIMICISYGIVARTPITTGGMYPTGGTDFRNLGQWLTKSVDTEKESEFKMSLTALIEEVEMYNFIKGVVKWVLIAGYFTYVGFILSITNWRNIFNSKKKQL